MIYSKEDILLAARFESDKSSIYCTGDCVIENIMESMSTTDDADIFLEDGSKVFQTLSSQMKAVFNRIMDFVKAQIRKVQEYRQEAKYKKLMSPEMKMTLERVKKGEKIPCPDIEKAAELGKKYESIMNAYIKFAMDALDKIKSSDLSNKQLDAIMDKVDKKADEVTDELEKMAADIAKVLTDKHDMTVKDVYKMVDCGFAAIDSINNYLSDLDRNSVSALKNFDAVLASMDIDGFKEYVESCEEFYTIEDETIVYEGGKIKVAVSKIRASVNKIIRTIDKSLTKHAKTISLILAAISVGCGVLAVNAGVSNENAYKKKNKDNEEDRASSLDMIRQTAAERHRIFHDCEKEASKTLGKDTARIMYAKRHERVASDSRKDRDEINAGHDHYKKSIKDERKRGYRKPALTALGSVASGAAALAMSHKGKK